MFVYLSFRQDLTAVIAGFEAAWAFFGGVFGVVIVDNMGQRFTGTSHRLLPHSPAAVPGAGSHPWTRCYPPRRRRNEHPARREGRRPCRRLRSGNLSRGSRHGSPYSAHTGGPCCPGTAEPGYARSSRGPLCFGHGSVRTSGRRPTQHRGRSGPGGAAIPVPPRHPLPAWTRSSSRC